MKAPYRIGIPPQLNALYIERQPNEYWIIPIHTNPQQTLGTFLHLYDDGRIEQVTVRVDRGDETITIKPKD